MSKYFEPVDFSELNPPKKVEKTQNTDYPDKNDPQVLVGEFTRMLRAVESGQSDLIKGAISLHKAPVQKALERFSENPDGKTLLTFFNLVEQDVNARVKNEMILIAKKLNKQLDEFITGLGV